MDEQTKNLILEFQRNELTEHLVYKRLSELVKNKHNSEILRKISEDELRHHDIWKKYTGQSVKPRLFFYWFYTIVSMLFGVTFGIKLMESGESNAQTAYASLADIVPESSDIQNEEENHEKQLIGMISEEKLQYMGSVVLGLNDALVEFTGALAGFTFALQSSKLIGMVGLIMGISAALSMAASEYLSTKTEEGEKNPRKASLYTGLAYILTVVALVCPFFIIMNFYLAMLLTIGLAILLILLFTFYTSVTNDFNFKKRFLEMFTISMGVAALSFLIGLIVNKTMNVDV